MLRKKAGKRAGQPNIRWRKRWKNLVSGESRANGAWLRRIRCAGLPAACRGRGRDRTNAQARSHGSHATTSNLPKERGSMHRPLTSTYGALFEWPQGASMPVAHPELVEVKLEKM